MSSLGNFLFWGPLCGKSPIYKVCDTLQQAGTSPQQLLVRQMKALMEVSSVVLFHLMFWFIYLFIIISSCNCVNLKSQVRSVLLCKRLLVQSQILHNIWIVFGNNDNKLYILMVIFFVIIDHKCMWQNFTNELNARFQTCFQTQLCPPLVCLCCFNHVDYDPFFLSCLSFVNFQSVLLSVWLQREKEILQKPEQTTVNLHTLLITLSNMKGMS